MGKNLDEADNLAGRVMGGSLISQQLQTPSLLFYDETNVHLTWKCLFLMWLKAAAPGAPCSSDGSVL